KSPKSWLSGARRSINIVLEPVVMQKIGPEKICPKDHEELVLQETPYGTTDLVEKWRSEVTEEEEEEDGSNGYFYKSLDQDPDQGPATAEETYSCSSISMDPEHVELEKRAMSGIKLPTLRIPEAMRPHMTSSRIWYSKSHKPDRVRVGQSLDGSEDEGLWWNSISMKCCTFHELL
uniref:Male-enhanced antigen 1 n=1 Tax=Salvator merianae TaxID=96440 RepID=A0A8D0B3I5_SALMN